MVSKGVKRRVQRRKKEGPKEEKGGFTGHKATALTKVPV